jgi:hypothetical protein
MHEQNRHLSSWLFYVLVAVLTNLILGVIEALSIALSGVPHGMGIVLLSAGLTKSPLLGIITWLIVKGGGTRQTGVRAIGGVLGAYTGFLSGAFVGSSLGIKFGGLIGLITMFFLFRYVVGPWVSSSVSRLLENVFVVE